MVKSLSTPSIVTLIKKFMHEIDIEKQSTSNDELLRQVQQYFQSLITKYTKGIQKLEFTETLLLIFSLLPHIDPNYLDLFFLQKLGEGNFPQLGGVRGKQHRGIIPTGELMLFLLAGDDLEKRQLVRKTYLNNTSWLVKEKILCIEAPLPGEPRLSGKLLMSEDYVDLFLNGKFGAPTFDTEFPAQLLHTKQSWSDLVLHPHTLCQLDHLRSWLNFGEEVLNTWNLDKIVPLGYRVLFYGPSGTGKTLAASLLGQPPPNDEKASSIISNTLSRPVYRIDLSMIVSKYIGETEKNLAKLFAKAEHKNWILFFDEADALFGKRTGVNSSHDRYANQEISYLLQRVEAYDGLVILATNLKENIDEAFLRRFQSIIHFPLPRPSERLKLWENAIPAQVQLEETIKLQELANQYELTGADIVNIIHYCCIKAMSRGKATLLHTDLLEGIRQELAKKGKHTAF